MSDHLFKAGTVEHLVELTTCSQVGGTGYRKVWVCFPCLQGVSPNLSQYHSRSIWNIHEWKKINTPNGIWLKMLICKSVYQKAKVIFLCAIEKKKVKFAIPLKPIWVENVPNLDKKNWDTSLRCPISAHHHWEQGKMPSSPVQANQTHHNNTEEHKSLKVSHQGRYQNQDSLN